MRLTLYCVMLVSLAAFIHNAGARQSSAKLLKVIGRKPDSANSKPESGTDEPSDKGSAGKSAKDSITLTRNSVHEEIKQAQEKYILVDKYENEDPYAPSYYQKPQPEYYLPPYYKASYEVYQPEYYKPKKSPEEYKPSYYKPEEEYYKPSYYKPSYYKPEEEYKPSYYKPKDTYDQYKQPEYYKPSYYKPEEEYKPSYYKPKDTYDEYKQPEYYKPKKSPEEYKPAYYKPEEEYKPSYYKPYSDEKQVYSTYNKYSSYYPSK